MIEHIVDGQLQAFLDEVSCLDIFQPVFKPGHGNETALGTLVDNPHWEMDRDSVNLLDCLSGLGLRSTILWWFQSYLEGRYQKVTLEDWYSTLWYWAPTGLHLVPFTL